MLVHNFHSLKNFRKHCSRDCAFSHVCSFHGFTVLVLCTLISYDYLMAIWCQFVGYLTVESLNLTVESLNLIYHNYCIVSTFGFLPPLRSYSGLLALGGYTSTDKVSHLQSRSGSPWQLIRCSCLAKGQPHTDLRTGSCSAYIFTCIWYSCAFVWEKDNLSG